MEKPEKETGDTAGEKPEIKKENEVVRTKIGGFTVV
jgi:hypothetical protein